MTNAERDALRAELQTLVKARTEFLTGKRVVTAQYNGRSVTYAAADLNEIRRRIAEIESRLGLSRRGAIGVRFTHR
ncbi:gpW family head-tail joining protein [Dongia soli]|uniref:GpW family head-tail joining protein n=1 Tax=Dongia soli TaxID=600628 RepID=A0ABU5E7Y3_9PROT|nr:gpW family head-tail joining protein [Dongia soli]MDY0882296.1 gpW family head-tail joining protein [Dongia soli]